MGEIFSQLGQLFVQSIPTIIFVFLLLVILDRLFFRPLTTILKQREEATLGALARAREQAAAAEAKSRQYEAAFQAARQEVYRRREAERRTALGEREIALRKAREQSEAMLRDAQAALTAEVTATKRELEGACCSLAQQITETILSTASPADEVGGARS
jgi:F-type H+-transporting ATPase subunit b